MSGSFVTGLLVGLLAGGVLGTFFVAIVTAGSYRRLLQPDRTPGGPLVLRVHRHTPGQSPPCGSISCSASTTQITTWIFRSPMLTTSSER